MTGVGVENVWKPKLSFVRIVSNVRIAGIVGFDSNLFLTIDIIIVIYVSIT